MLGSLKVKPMAHRYALALLLALVAVLLGCGSADGDPAQRVEKPVPVTATKE